MAFYREQLNLLFQNFKTAYKNIGNSRRNRRKTVEKWRKKYKWIWNNYFKSLFLAELLFSIKMPTFHKDSFLKILYIFWDIDKNIMRKLKFFFMGRVSCLLPITGTEWQVWAQTLRYWNFFYANENKKIFRTFHEFMSLSYFCNKYCLFNKPLSTQYSTLNQ